MIKTKKKTPFETLLLAAVETAEKLTELEASSRLSAGAFLREAVSIANTTPERIRKLRAAIETAPEHSIPSINSFIRGMLKVFKQGRFSQPTQDARRLSPFGAEAAAGELVKFQSHVLELQALVVELASERYPETFGGIEDRKAHSARLSELKILRETLFSRIPKEYAPADIALGDIGQDGRARPTFAITGGEVPLGPLSNSGERLVGWLLGNQIEAFKEGG